MALTLEKLAEALDTTPQGPWARPIRMVHEAAIVAGVTCVVLATQPDIDRDWDWLFAPVIWFVALVFAIEYALRLAIAPWAHWAHKRRAVARALPLGDQFRRHRRPGRNHAAHRARGRRAGRDGAAVRRAVAV